MSLLGTAGAGALRGMMSSRQSGISWVWSQAGDAQQGCCGSCCPLPKGGWAQHWLPAASPGVSPGPWGHLQALPLCVLEALRSLGGRIWGGCGSSGAGGGCGVTSEHLALCILLRLHWSAGHCVSRGKKCPEIPQTLQYRFCFTVRQKGALCVRAERNSPVPQPPQKLNVNYLPPRAFT